MGKARRIAEEAYIWGYPMVDNLRIHHAFFADPKSPEFKAPYNELTNTPRVFTPEDKAVQTPNSDTLYSWLGLDLRREPLVITVPKIEAGRYWSIQLIDLYTHNFDYLGTRTTGNAGGSFLIAGPGWKGAPPPGIAKVVRSETWLGLALFRTQLFSVADLESAKMIQSQYRVQALSAFLGEPAPAAAPTIQFPAPLTREQQRSSLEFFNVLSFGLQFCPPHPSDKELIARFAEIDVGAGRSIDTVSLSPERKQDLSTGIENAWQTFAGVTARVERGEIDSSDVFGTREHVANHPLVRMAGAVYGIYGNTREEALYPIYRIDADGERLDASRHEYIIRFAPGQLPPVNAFWSLTMYDAESLLVPNPLGHYLINSAMLPDLKRDADGGLTLYLQHRSPGHDKESNWLPAPNGELTAILRMYWPKAETLTGVWKAPPLQKRQTGMLVTLDTYIRAETDRNFRNIVELAGAINQLHHIRQPTPLDQQPVVRMNRDTLYSGAIVDTAKGATLTLPKPPDDRYMSALLIDNDHYCSAVIYQPGTHPLPTDTKYLAVLLRIQLRDPHDRAEIELVNRLQDLVSVKAGSADELPPLPWDRTSLEALTKRYKEEAVAISRWKGVMGPRGKVNEATRHLACAAAWGLFPEQDAIYLNYDGKHDHRRGYRATYQVPEHQAFWSITVYGKDGYIEHDNNIVNSSNVTMNRDGTFTVYFGSRKLCGDVPNRLDVTEGWNFLMRIYRPGRSVLDGTYTLPRAVEISPSKELDAPARR